MSVSKPEILNKVAKNFPNLLKKDLNKLFEIFLQEIIKALKNGERVELRDSLGTFEARIQKKKNIFKSKNIRKGWSSWKKEHYV